jgi:hypothetical protein
VHSSRRGRTSAALCVASSEAGAETTEDIINRITQAKKLLPPELKRFHFPLGSIVYEKSIGVEEYHWWQ